MIDLGIDLDVASAKWKAAFPRRDLKIKVAAACAFMGAKKPKAFEGRVVDISIILTDNRTIKKLNRDYLGKDKATNVLSFPQLQIKGLKARDLAIYPKSSPLPLGDVVLAFETIKKEAKEQKKKIEDHVAHLVVHGVLHLLGYDHMTARDAKTMESLECDILALLGYADPYADTET